ncbi:FAR-17a/AIG1-like protein [Cunninghamella echinulata]|nr:FAR-17a/AIG1-like protein [Cunninghamella echinulata]
MVKKNKKEESTFSLSQYTCLALNVTGLFSNLLTFYAIHYLYINPYAEQAFGGHFQYLTIIGLAIATVAFAVNMVRVFSPASLEMLYEVVYHVATPLEAIISVLYWTMVLVDPELLIPKDIEPIPLLVDLGLHLYPTICLWIDLFFFKPTFKRSWRHFIYIYSFVGFYYGWSYYCKLRNGHWPYPFLDEFPNAWARFSFYFISGTVSWIMYETGAYIHASIYKKKLEKLA